VLSTLWSVDDVAASELMAGFYRNILSGKAKAASLREAQMAFLSKEGSATLTRGAFLATREASPRTIAYAHPYFWAPFVLVGDGGLTTCLEAGHAATGRRQVGGLSGLAEKPVTLCATKPCTPVRERFPSKIAAPRAVRVAV